MTDTNTNPPAEKSPSNVGRIAAAIMAVLAIGGGGYWYMHSHHGVTTASNAKKPPLVGMLGDNLTALDTTLPAQDKICSTTLARALDFGVVPAGARLVSQDAQAGQPDGHYTCQAQGSDGKYTLAIDATCPGSQDKTCYALETVKREDGTTVYQRRFWPS
jgi:hypothetical protein